MKRYYSYFMFLSVLLVMGACSRSDNPVVDPNKPVVKRVTTDEQFYANVFASDVLSDVYLWSKEINSDLSKLDENTNNDPIGIVKTIRYKKNGKDVDKWTMLTDDFASFSSSVEGVETTFGWSLTAGKFNNTNNYFFIVQYVYKDSPAAKAGLKRGDIIIKIDGANITKDNYMQLFNAGSLKITMGVLKDKTIDVGQDMTLTAVKMYEDPVLVSKVFDCGGKKVGYLAFTAFDLNSIPELIAACKAIKAEGAKELILDLRYNGGGYVITEELLASIFAPADAVSAGGVFHANIWNDKYTEYWQKKNSDQHSYLKANHKYSASDGTTKSVNTTDANMGLTKIYAIISSGTASASEGLLIGLMPYTPIELIGETSHGKYCTGSILSTKDLYDNKVPSSISNWGIYVMISRFVNKNGENPSMPDGLQPTTAVEDYPFDGYQLGDEHETMLKAALIKAGKTDIVGKTMSRAANLPAYELINLHRDARFGKSIDNRPEIMKVLKEDLSKKIRVRE